MGEMGTSKTLDQEIELLLAGTPIEGGRLSDLASVLGVIRTQWTPAPPEADIAHFARSAASVVKQNQSQATAATTLQRRLAMPRLGLTPRLATVALTILLMSGTAGMAMAADSAAPGDALYGLDRAFEAVGIGSGSTEERLDEAVALAAQGHSGEALEHAIQGLRRDTGGSSEAAVTALTTAAQSLVETQDTADAATAASIRVTALLTYVAENIGIDEGTDGREFGQGVAQLARDIGEGDDPTGAQDPVVAPAPGPGQSNDPGPGAGNEGADEADDGAVPGNGNENSQNNGNSQNDESGDGQGSDPPVESPSVTAPGRGNDAPEDSPSATAPGKGNKP
jgi:hypothetical protein